MPGVRIQPVGGGSIGPVVAKKSASPPTPSYQEFYAGRDDFDKYQGSNGSESSDLRRNKRSHKNDVSKAEKIFATSDQKKILMDSYLSNNYPTLEDMIRLTEITGLDERFLKQWFQYTRKFMKSKGKIPVRIELPPESQFSTGTASSVEREFVSFQYDPKDAIEPVIDKDSFTHEEAIEKAMQYDNLKKKFDELHKNFMNLSSALLKKGFRGDDDPEPTPTPPQSSSPPTQEPSENAREEFPESGDKTLNGPFRPRDDSTSTPLVARIKQEKEDDSDNQTKKEPIDNDENKDDPSKNLNLPMFPQEPKPYPPPYHAGPYPPHPMYPPYQNPNLYNPNLPPHMQPPPTWPPYQQPTWNPNYPPYGSAPAGYPPSNFPPPPQNQAKFNPATSGYPAPSYPPPPPNAANFQPPPQSNYPGQTPPPSNPFHTTPPPPPVTGQTPPPPYHQPQHPPYPPHPYHHQPSQYQDQFKNRHDPNNPPPPFGAYNHPQDPNLVPTDNMQIKSEEPNQMKSEETKVKTEEMSPLPATDSEMTDDQSNTT